MNRACGLALGVWCLASLASAQAVVNQRWYGQYPRYPAARQSGELTVAELRKLGLSDKQILKIAEQRRDIERQREELDKKIEAARAAAAAANAHVAALNGQIRTLTTEGIEKVYESVMTKPQLEAYHRQRYVDQAKQWLRSYKNWLKLTDEQVDDIAGLLVPVFEKYDKRQGHLADARTHLAELRRADKIDIAAIDAAEKEVAELSKPNVYQERQKELRDAMRAGLLPDQLERLDRVRRR